MPVSRLRHIPGIGVDKVGDAADAAGDPRFLRLENLDTDIPPPVIARQVTHGQSHTAWSPTGRRLCKCPAQPHLTGHTPN